MAKIDFETQIRTLTGQSSTVGDYKGKVILIVNTASQCGFTPQFKGLEVLWQAHKDAGFVVLGFPCNQFGQQEPGSAAEISEFCQLNYGVSFPMHAKVNVNGAEAHSLYLQLKAAKKGLLGTAAIKWNFTKFLLDREGEIVERFGPRTEPKSLEEAIQKYL